MQHDPLGKNVGEITLIRGTAGTSGVHASIARTCTIYAATAKRNNRDSPDLLSTVKSIPYERVRSVFSLGLPASSPPCATRRGYTSGYAINLPARAPPDPPPIAFNRTIARKSRRKFVTRRRGINVTVDNEDTNLSSLIKHRHEPAHLFHRISSRLEQVSTIDSFQQRLVYSVFGSFR